MFCDMLIYAVYDSTDMNAFLTAVSRLKLYLLVTNVVCTQSMLLRNILYSSFENRLQQCFVTGHPMNYSRIENFTGRNLLLEHIAEWWVDREANHTPPSSLLQCPITHDIMLEVYLLSDGTSYSKQLLEWLKVNSTSPLTRKDLYNEAACGVFLYENRVAKFAITYIQSATAHLAQHPHKRHKRTNKVG